MKTDKKYAELRKKAEQILQIKDAGKQVDYLQDIEKLVEELNILQIELEMQNQELQSANSKLEKEQQKYKQLYMSAPVAYFTLNKTGNIIDLNLSAADLLAMPIQSFKFTSIFPYLEDQSKIEFTKYFKKVFDSEEIEYGSLVFINSRNEAVFTNLSSVSYFDDLMQERLIRCTVIDKTQLKLYEKEIEKQKRLNETIKRYETIFSTTNAGICLATPELQVIDCNRSFAEMLGYRIEEIKQIGIAPITFVEDIPSEIEKVSQISKENSQTRYNKRYIKKNGDILWGDLTVSACYNDDDSINYYIGILVDISDRKLVENELIESKARFKALSDNSFDIMNILAHDGTIKYESFATDRVLGYPAGQRVGLNALSFIHPDDYNRITAEFQLLVTEQKSIKLVEFRYQHSNGSWVWLETSGQNFLDNPNVNGIIINSRDITKRKQIEQNLSENQQLLELFFNQSHEGIFFMMLDEPVVWNDSIDKEMALDYIFSHQRITKVNDAMLAQYHATREQFLYLTPNDFFEHDIEHGKDVWRKFFDEGKLHIDTIEKRFDGTDMIINGDYTLLLDAQGRVTGHFGVQQDVTELRQAEKELEESRYFLDLLLESIPIPLFYKDIEGRYTGFNKAFEEFFGKTKEDLIGKTVYDINPHDLAKIYFEKDKKLFSEKGIQVYESQVVNSREEVSEVIFHKASIVDINGNITGVIGTAIDITELKKAKRQLANERNYLRQIIDTIPSFVCVKDYSGRFVLANKALSNAYGTTPEKIIGKTDFDFNPNIEEVKVFLGTDRKVIFDKETLRINDEKITYADGSVHWVSTIKTPLVEEDGSCTQLLAVAMDITELKKAQERLQELVNELQSANVTKDKFFGIIAHDLRSPISGIIALTRDFIADIETSKISDIKKMVESIALSSRNLYKLLENLLHWSRINRGLVEYNPMSLKLKDFGDEAIALMNDKIRKKEINCVNRISEKIRVYVDNGMADTIFRNLISNALKFSNKKGKVIIDAKLLNDSFVEVSISDSGIGISSNEVSNLFNIEQKIIRKGTNGEQGTGLGLIISKEYIEKHGGKIWVNSIEGKGSVFSFTLPVKK